MKVILLCSFLLLVGCNEITYYEPQPKGVASLKEIPLSLQGRYRSHEEDGINADTVTISANGYALVKHEDHAILGDSIILKYYKRYYYYNILGEDGTWLLRLITVDQNGDLSIWSMKQPHDDYRELIKTLSKKVKVDSTVTFINTKAYRIDPTPKQMNRLIRKGYFTKDGTLKKSNSPHPYSPTWNFSKNKVDKSYGIRNGEASPVKDVSPNLTSMRIFTTTLILLVVVMINVCAQGTRVVKGTLTDPDSGVPMPGVNVMIKGTTTGTTTDVDGNYEIEAPIGSFLVFSFVGYKTTEMEVTPAPGESEGPPQKVFRHTVPDNPEKTLSPYFFIKSDDPQVDQMPLKSTAADVSIAGVIADVHVKQVYINTGKNPLEAVYIFPGSTRAAVYAMSMTIGNRKLIAKIKEKEKARQEYTQAKQEGKTATLLEQKRPNVFQMNVANILPGDTISVDLQYTELLVPVNGTYEFVYPTVVGPRYSETPDDDAHASEQWIKNPFQSEGEAPAYAFDLGIKLNTGIPLQRVVSPSHAVHVDFKSSNSARVTLDASEGSGGDRDFILRYRLRGGSVQSGLLLYPRQDENFFLLMMEPPDAPKLDQIPPREYIFVVDVSGSMQGFPIEVSKRLLRKLISSLRPTDRFNVMLFESSNTMLHDRSVPATEANIDFAIGVLDKQEGGGGTRLYPALQKALAYDKPDGFSRTFIVVTDGYVTVEKEAFSLVRDNLNRANLFAFGIGSSVNRYLIEGLAHAGMGEPFFVTNEKEAESVGKKFIDVIQNPVLTDIKIDFDNFAVYDVEPINVPDVFVERPIIVFGKYKGGANGTIKVSGKSGDEKYTQTIDVNSAAQEHNEALRYLWARHKIKYLDDYAGYFEGDNDGYGGKPGTSEARQQLVTELGLKYNLLTQYTSFIAVDSLIRNPGGNLDKVKQPLPLPQGVSNAAIALRGLSLQPDVQSLTEVVVCGYGVQEKRALTCAVTTISQENLSNSYSVNFNNMLQGRVAGVSVTSNDGSPGNNYTVRIRGNTSLTGSSGPLYIVDGVPIDNTDHPMGTAGGDGPDRIADINPNDIGSITVLKSASATALYGSRAANGVVLITTKEPRVGKREMSLTSTFSIEKPNKLPELQDHYAQGQSDNGQLAWRGPETQQLFSWGPAMKDLMYDGNPYAYDSKGKLIPLTNGGTPASPYDRYGFFRTGFVADNYFHMSRAMDKTKYSVALGNTIQHGIVPGSSLNRTTLRIYGEKKLGYKLTLGSSAILSHSTSDRVQHGNSPSSVMFGLLTTPASFDNGNGLSGNQAAKDPGSYELADETQRSYSAGRVDNPYWSINKNPYALTLNRIIPSVNADFRITSNLIAKYKLSADVYEDRQESGFDLHSAAAPLGQLTHREEDYRHLNSELTLRGEKELFNNDLNLTVTAGLINFAARREVSRVDGTELNESGNFNPDNASSTTRYSIRYDQSNTRVVSQVNMNYKHLLVLDLAGAWEHTSTLADDHNQLRSAGTGLAFIFTELPTFSGASWINSGKINFSAGQIQKEAPLFVDPNFLTAPTAGITTPALNVERVRVADVTNLTPERVSSWEGGTSLGFLDGRLEVTAAWYAGTTSNLMVPMLNAFSVTMVNGGVLSNNGFELNLQASPLTQSLRWRIDVNFSKYKSLVKELQGSTDRIAMSGFSSISSNLIKGQPYGVLYGTRYLRNNEGEKIIGTDGFPLVDPTMSVLGDPNPDWTMGIKNSLSLANFSLDFLVDIKRGGDVWNGTKNTMNYFGTSASTASDRTITQYVFAGVTETGEQNTKAVDFYNPANPLSENRWVRYGMTGVAEDAIEDGSWVRLRQLSFSYQFDQSLTSKLGLQKLSLTFVARNLFLITRYSGIDPETNLTGNTSGRGLDYFNLPNTKSYGLSLRIGL